MNVQSHCPKPQVLKEEPSHATKAAELPLLRLRLSKWHINTLNICLELGERHGTFCCGLRLCLGHAGNQLKEEKVSHVIPLVGWVTT